MSDGDPQSFSDTPTSRLADGVRYLRGGSLDRARASFEAAAESSEPEIRTEALRRLADVKRRHAAWDEALALAAEAARVAAAHALVEDEAAALNIEGTIHLQRGDTEAAIEVYGTALSREPGPLQKGLIAQNLGTAYAQQGALARATDWYAISSRSFQIAGLQREALIAQVNEANLRLDIGDLEAAELSFRTALTDISGLPGPDAELQGLIEMNLAETLCRRRKDLDHALNLILSATGQFSASENRPYLVACHRVLGLILESQGDLETAVSALERGVRLAREIGSGPELARLDRELTRLTGAYDGTVAEPDA